MELDYGDIANGATQELVELVDEAIGVDDLGPQGLAAREGEERLGQARSAISCAMERADHALGLLARHLALQEVEIAGNHGQEIVEIMRDAAGELADGFEFLRLSKPLARLLELLRHLEAAGDIARHTPEAGQAARLVIHRME